MALTDFDNEFAAPVETPVEGSTETEGVETPAESLVEEITPTISESAPQKFRREIKVEGGGTQVFEADTAEELIEKLAVAQENATKKIREQQAKIRKQPERHEDDPRSRRSEPSGVSGKRELTADQKFALAQKFQSDPDAAFDELYEAKFGTKPGVVEEFVTQLKWEREVNAIDSAFLAENPDFHQSAANAAAMVNYLKSEDLPYTKANLEYAFQELSESGLLEAKPDANATQESKSGESQRITEKPTTRSKQMSTGIRSSSVTNRRAVDPKTESESDVRKILEEPDLDKARQLMLKQMARARSSR